MDFAVELEKLIREENPPPVDPLTELARAQAAVLNGIQKNSDGLSLQMEEVYDIVKNSDENAKEVKIAAKRENMLLGGLVALSDLLDDLLPHIREHSHTVAAKKDGVINACGLERLGFPGERLEPRLHEVTGAEFSETPPETVTRVLAAGYAYNGRIIRKATVILSKGEQNI